MTGSDQDDRGRHASPDLVCDWCELPVIGEAWDWHCTVGHPRCIVRAAVQVWVSRQIGEIPPPIDHAALEATRKNGECAWCFDPLADRRADFNGASGHPECARHAWEAVAGDGAMPWPIPEPSVYECAAFLERLARAAAKHKLPARRLRLAIKEAMNV